MVVGALKDDISRCVFYNQRQPNLLEDPGTFYIDRDDQIMTILTGAYPGDSDVIFMASHRKNGTQNPVGPKIFGHYPIRVSHFADLAILKSADNATPNEGDTLLYSIVITNNGPSDATGVAVSEPLTTT